MTDIATLMATKPSITPVDLADRLDVTTQTVYNWIAGRSPGPPYLREAICAAKYGYKPALEAKTHSMYKQLGVTRQHVHGWKLCGTPMPARMAVRWMMK